MQEISERIRKARIERGWTQEELAIRCGYKSRSSINKLERNAYECGLESIKKVARALNVAPDYLIFGDENDKRAEINRLFDLLPEDKQEAVLAFLRSMLGDRAKV